jgi:hypothetical protein
MDLQPELAILAQMEAEAQAADMQDDSPPMAALAPSWSDEGDEEVAAEWWGSSGSCL